MSTIPCDHKFVDSATCLKCGIGFEALKAQSLAASQANQDLVPDAVAAEIETACNDVPTGKMGDHFKARRKLFEEVDRQIRGRVKEVLPGVTLEFKQQIDKDLGLDALRKRVATLADGVAKDLAAVRSQLDTMLQERLEQMIGDAFERAHADVVARFERRVEAIVAKECGLQVTRLLLQGPAAKARPAPSVERRVRVKKPRTR